MYRIVGIVLALFICLMPLEAKKQKPTHVPVTHPKHSKVRKQKPPKTARKPAH